MAGRIGTAKIAGVTTGTALKTMIQLIAAANHAIKIKQFVVGFHGTSATAEPIKVEIVRQTDAGTMSALTPVKADDSNGDTLDTTAQHTATAEPTPGDILVNIPVHPQTSLVYEPPWDAPIVVGAGDRLGFTTTAAVAVNCDMTVIFEE